MAPEETVSEKSILDKPLHLLTEDDISQLTREDCRRYLKQKGMRRPSWNKSQAIQQVISLKALLEPSPETDSTAPRKKIYSPPYNFTVPRTALRGKSPDLELSEETAVEPYERFDREKPTVSGYPAAAAAAFDSIPPRNRGSDNMTIGQMTVFYSGKVSVYDDIPADKAQAILHLAASQLPLPPDVSLDDILATQPGCYMPDISPKIIPSSTAFPTSQTVKIYEKPRLLGEGCRSPDEYPVKIYEKPRLLGEGCRSPDEYPATEEGRGSRKASVQRYLEKRKDRLKHIIT